eukprot:3153735-Rhodomonas_salina.1
MSACPRETRGGQSHIQPESEVPRTKLGTQGIEGRNVDPLGYQENIEVTRIILEESSPITASLRFDICPERREGRAREPRQNHCGITIDRAESDALRRANNPHGRERKRERKGWLKDGRNESERSSKEEVKTKKQKDERKRKEERGERE